MDTKRSQAASFRKVREDHSSETAEDYLEALWEIRTETGQCRIVDLARHMGVSHVTVIKRIARLKEQGLVRTEPYQPIELTPLGRRLAAACRRRHEIVQSFLVAIGVPMPDARRDAEGIEHHVSEATLERMESFLRGDAPLSAAG